MKTHRVGTITLGCMLIVFGILLLLHLFIPALTYTTILNYWPVSFILLGLEVLATNIRSNKVTFIYDGWSIILLFFILGFTMFMGITEKYIF